MKSLQKNRAILFGAAIADAAARPLHWIYDAQKLDKLAFPHLLKVFKIVSILLAILILHNFVNCLRAGD